MTYAVHRYGLHSEQSPFTKMHANWQHTIPTPFSLVAHYDHPITYLIHVFIPTYLPAVLFRFHILTYLMYLAVVSLEETFAYSGYNMLPSAFILGGIARRQEMHLVGGNGNYGCFGLLDFVMGTSIGEDLVNDVIDEAEEKQVAKKSRGRVKAAGKKVLKKAPRKRVEEDEKDEDQNEGGEEHQQEEEEDETPPRSKRSLNKSGKKGVDTHKEDANGVSPEQEDERPTKRSSRTRRGEKRSSEEDAEAGGQDEDPKAEEEQPRSKARGVTRKGSQKSKAASRSRKRSEEDDE